jgi:hypothetical protein
MALKYLLRFRDRVKHPQRLQQIVDKNILINVYDGGHHGEAGHYAQLHEKCHNIAALEYILLELNQDIELKRKLKF